MKKIAYGLILAVISNPVAALNKCTDPEGNITYSDKPCITVHPGATAESVNIQPSPSHSVPGNTAGLRQGEKEALRRIQRREDSKRRQRDLDRRIWEAQQKVKNDFARIDEKYDRERCAIYTRSYNRYSGRLKSGYSIGESDYLHERQAESRAKMNEYCK